MVHEWLAFRLSVKSSDGNRHVEVGGQFAIAGKVGEPIVVGETRGFLEGVFRRSAIQDEEHGQSLDSARRRIEPRHKSASAGFGLSNSKAKARFERPVVAPVPHGFLVVRVVAGVKISVGRREAGDRTAFKAGGQSPLTDREGDVRVVGSGSLALNFAFGIAPGEGCGGRSVTDEAHVIGICDKILLGTDQGFELHEARSLEDGNPQLAPEGTGAQAVDIYPGAILVPEYFCRPCHQFRDVGVVGTLGRIIKENVERTGVRRSSLRGQPRSHCHEDCRVDVLEELRETVSRSYRKDVEALQEGSPGGQVDLEAGLLVEGERPVQSEPSPSWLTLTFETPSAS